MYSPTLSFALAAFVSVVFPRNALATLPFGHYGPEGTVLFLNGFHFVSGHPDWEISANHYCTIIRDDLLQCAVYNTATAPAHLAGIEYIISKDAFNTLDYEGTAGALFSTSFWSLISEKNVNSGTATPTRLLADSSSSPVSLIQLTTPS
jgi:hypothetical protein